MDGDIKNFYSKKVEEKKSELTDDEYNELYEMSVCQTEQFVRLLPDDSNFNKVEYIYDTYSIDIEQYINQRYNVFFRRSKTKIKRCVY